MSEKADVAVKITQAIVAYVAGDGSQLMPVMQFLTMVLPFTAEEAEAILEKLESESVLESGEIEDDEELGEMA